MQCSIGQSHCEWPAGVGNGSATAEAYDDADARRLSASTSNASHFALMHEPRHQQPAHLVMASGNQTTPPFSTHTVQHISPSSHGHPIQLTNSHEWQTPSNDSLLQDPIDTSTIGPNHVPDLGWMMNELGVAYDGSLAMTSHATESPTSSSATGTNDLATRSKEARAGLGALTREEIFARAFGILARACKDTVGTDALLAAMSASHKASRCLSSRFDGLENVQEQVVSYEEIQQQLQFALAEVGETLHRPSSDGVVALVYLAWAMYGEGDRQACSRYARSAYMLLTYLDEDASGLEVWLMTDLLVELAMRGTSTDLIHIAQQMREEIDIPLPEEADHHPDSGLLAASMRIQQSAYDLSRFINTKGSGAATPALSAGRSGGSQTIKNIFRVAQDVYAEVGIELNVPSTSVNNTTLDEVESMSSAVYEGMASCLKFNVNNFAKHDRRGQGTEFLALHIKYEALMCTICQVRAFAAAADEQAEEVAATALALEELRTGASAARSLADDLVVAEALAPWTVAANPSLDRYIFIAALGVLILFKATNGRWTILAEETGAVHARKRLLSNVLRQNFSACLRALQLLSKVRRWNMNMTMTLC